MAQVKLNDMAKKTDIGPVVAGDISGGDQVVTSNKPKMMDVSTMVRPRDRNYESKLKHLYTEEESSAQDLDQDSSLATGGEDNGVRPKMMDATTMVRPNDKDLEPQFKNASTQARPRGYKELDLRSTMALGEEKEVQVTELDLEKSTAADSHGIVLNEGNIFWPNIVNFNSDLAEMKIKTYITSFWRLGSEWMFDIRYIQTHATNYRKKFIYEVVFSKPTKEHPVPPATASVFFVFEAEHYSCPDQSMKVHFVLEGNRFPYTPGVVQFREDWLTGIIHDKLCIQKAINF